MSKILIISMLFQPQNKIGAVRPTNFARWLAEFGHQIDVITLNPESPELTYGNLKVFHVPNGKHISDILNKKYNKIAKKKKFGLQKYKEQKEVRSPLKGLRSLLLTLIQSFDWRNQCLKHLSQMSIDDQYDIVFSSFGPIGSYWLGRALYKRRLAKYWVSDLRDLMVSQTLPSWLNRVYGHYQKQMLREATAITVVSDGIALSLTEQYCENKDQKKKVNTINNGYEITHIFHESAEDGTLRICYTGTLYSGQRDMALLFEALSALVTEKRVEPEKIEVHYAGGESEELFLQASPYDVNGCIVDHGFVARDDALGLQNNSDLMVVLSWNTQNEQGILTGKFFEYLAVERPIISITSGDLPNAELTHLINDMNLGIACEYVSKNKDLQLLKEYILNCYQCKRKGQQIPFNPRKEMVEEYRYDNLARKLESLFFSLIKD